MAEFIYQMYKARKAVGDKVILDDVTLSFYPGAKIGVVGPNGMGKSTLTNALVPEARARTNDISEALDTGKHTTTHAELYHLDAHSDLIDSPGLQEFGLSHLEATGLAHCFPEMRPLLGHCRFHNCAHLVEPGCALLAAHAAHETAGRRLPLLQKLTRQLKR